MLLNLEFTLLVEGNDFYRTLIEQFGKIGKDSSSFISVLKKIIRLF